MAQAVMQMSNSKLHWKHIVAGGSFDSNISKDTVERDANVGIGPLDEPSILEKVERED
jgi:hypothetical protein